MMGITKQFGFAKKNKKKNYSLLGAKLAFSISGFLDILLQLSRVFTHAFVKFTSLS